MAENLIIAEGGKAERYAALVAQIEALVAGETDATANMANVAASLKMTFGHLWVGFYVVKGLELVLGPFQGPVACTRIGYGRGVCGTAWKEARTVVVPDVEEFPGHIACSSDSRSEIVVPVFRGGSADPCSGFGCGSDEVVAVLDIDSDVVGSFDEIDALWLERICGLPVL